MNTTDDDTAIPNGINDLERLLKPGSLENSDAADVQDVQPPQPKVYARRYYIVVVFSMFVVIQGLIWNTWGPITKSAEAVYGWTDATVGLLSNWGPITYIISTPFLTWLMDVKGLRWSAIVSIVLVTIGAGLRCVPAEATTATWLVHTGHILNGLPGPVAMGAPTLLSATWFPAHQRITSTALCAASAGVGTGIAFIIGPLLVPDRGTDKHYNDVSTIKADIMKLLYIEFGIALVILVLVLLYFPARPPTPPSISAATERTEYKAGLWKLLRLPMFWIVALPYAISNGIYVAWSSVLEVNLKTRNVSQDLAGWVGFYSLIVGSLIGLVVGRFADIFKRNVKLYLIVLYIGAIFSFYIFAIAFDYFIPFSKELLYATNILTGMFIMSSVPLFYEFCCEQAYPISEGLTTGFLTCLNNFCGLIFLFILMIPNIGTLWMNWFCLGAIAICLPFLLFIREHYTRLDMDTPVKQGPINQD